MSIHNRLLLATYPSCSIVTFERKKSFLDVISGKCILYSFLCALFTHICILNIVCMEGSATGPNQMYWSRFESRHKTKSNVLGRSLNHHGGCCSL